MHKLNYWKTVLLPHHVFWAEMTLSLFFSVIIFNPLVSAVNVVRFQHRSLLMNNTLPGEVSKYNISFQYTTETNIGSVDLLFCTSPIPDDPCYPPVGLDASNATLLDQFGETGYSMNVRSSNHLVLQRGFSNPVLSVQSTYVLDGIKNQTDRMRPFSIRLSDYASTNASGPVVDLGSVVGVVNDSILIETQVPPILIFCVGKEVNDDCSTVDGGNYSDMGQMDPTSPITAQSQMAVGTNASGGFAITVNGGTLAAGNHVLTASPIPLPSVPGTNQFGINLVGNNDPTVGSDPDGDSTNAVAAATYSQPNKYAYKDGDVVAGSPNVSLVRRFTVSYVVNIRPDLHAGVYSTTLTYICSGRF